MYQVQNYDTGKRLASFDTMEEATADAQKRANRYHKPYAIMWFEPGIGTSLKLVNPS